MMISIDKTAMSKMANQLLLHSSGAKKPKMYSIPPIKPNRLVSETLNASFKCEDDIANSTIPLKRITALFK